MPVWWHLKSGFLHFHDHKISQLMFPWIFKLFGRLIWIFKLFREDISAILLCLVTHVRAEVFYSFGSVINHHNLTDTDVNARRQVLFGWCFPSAMPPYNTILYSWWLEEDMLFNSFWTIDIKKSQMFWPVLSKSQRYVLSNFSVPIIVLPS